LRKYSSSRERQKNSTGRNYAMAGRKDFSANRSTIGISKIEPLPSDNSSIFGPGNSLALGGTSMQQKFNAQPQRSNYNTASKFSSHWTKAIEDVPNPTNIEHQDSPIF
jgi:hypothetical protein